MPELPPVMTAILPSNLPICVSFPFLIACGPALRVWALTRVLEQAFQNHA